MIVVGIDPGLTGAIAVLDGDDAAVFDMPVTEANGKSAIDREKLADLIGLDALADYSEPEDATAFVERAQSSPGMGVSSAFNYGMGYGVALGILAHLRVPTRLVHPAVWKRAMGLEAPSRLKLGRRKQNKDASLSRARQLYPQLQEHLGLKKHHGRAEAILIAHWGAEELGL